ncbi:MAG: hypothetical protein KDI19_15280 [Pseudomonadales bacterium]|nr:hypothetical protein [Pseudomonadales bacterium]
MPQICWYASVLLVALDLTLNVETISRFHAAPGKFVIAAAGGGSTAIAGLLAVPGASRTLIEATVPYDSAALADYIGGKPDQACSGKTSRAMAMAALQRARRLASQPASLFGIGCTAALTTDRERRGQDRCYVALQSLAQTYEFSLLISRTGRSRAEQETLCSELLYRAIGIGKGVDVPELSLLRDESLGMHVETAEPEWLALFEGRLAFTNHAINTPRLVFPGAFNPVHEGHREMARVAEELTGETVLLEISAFNVDKPPLDYVDMRKRQLGIGDEFAFTFTNAPTFIAKSALFPNATYIVGSDTLERIGQTRYYNDNAELRDNALDTIASRGVRFLVFGRVKDDRFIGVDDVELPPVLRQISDGVPESAFRMDISSSAIRLIEDEQVSSSAE